MVIIRMKWIKLIAVEPPLCSTWQANLSIDYGWQEHMVTEKKETKPVAMNAFELISLSHGLNLSGLFETRQVPLLHFSMGIPTNIMVLDWIVKSCCELDWWLSIWLCVKSFRAPIVFILLNWFCRARRNKRRGSQVRSQPKRLSAVLRRLQGHWALMYKNVITRWNWKVISRAGRGICQLLQRWAVHHIEMATLFL